MAKAMLELQALLGAQNVTELECQIIKKHLRKAEEEIIEKLQTVFLDARFFYLLDLYRQQTACRFIGWRTIRIRLYSGERYPIQSPVFLRSKPKDRRRRAKRRDVTRHLGLELLGFQHKCSPLLVKNCISMATLCPSFDMGAQVLRSLGIRMDHRLLQTLCYRTADHIMTKRQANVVDPSWQKSGLRLLICIDGGRLRHRQSRRGRKKKGAKRHGYSTDWVAPWLLTIHCVDQTGKVLRKHRPIYDGTVGDIDAAFDLLRGYLERINVKESEVVSFCADGGNGIWERFEKLEETLPDVVAVHQVLDYTHAKQNLKEIADLIHQACGVWDYEYETVLKQLNTWLWQGKIDAIEMFINKRLHRKRQKKKAMKKLNGYFGDHRKFQYQTFQEAGLPMGSGTVESAIRRVINLRIKGPGQFWKLENAERMIFLRSQVLSGRWPFVLDSAINQPVNMLDYSILTQQPLAA